MIQDMNKTLTRLFTVALLMMVSMGAWAEIKIDLGGKDNKGVYEGGTVTAKQGEAKDGKVTVTLTFTPDKNYSITRKDVLLAYTAPTNTSGNTRADNTTLGETFNSSGSDDVFAYPKSATYTVTVDANLGLSVQKVEFKNSRDSGAKAGGDDDPKPIGYDYSGTYYIASYDNNNYSSTNTNSNYYLCPSEVFYDGDGYQTSGDMPYLTTYKTNRDAKSRWEVKFVKTDNNVDYYYVNHVSSSKYLTLNDSRSSDASRIRLHLQEEPATNGDELFYFTVDAKRGNSLTICPKNDSDGRSLNPAGNNYDSYSGTSNKTAKINNVDKNVGGLIGLYQKDDVRSVWILEEVVKRPTITIDASGNIAMTAEAGTIYYTTDGTNPTTSSSEYSSSFPISSIDNLKAIKAIAVNDDVTSKVASLTLTATFHVVNKRNQIALSYSGSVSNLVAPPSEIRSPYIPNNANYKLFTTKDAAYAYSIATTDAARNLAAEAATSITSDNQTFYVGYYYDEALQPADLPVLDGSKYYQMISNYGGTDNNYIYKPNSSANAGSHTSGTFTDSNHLWHFIGNDPYDIRVANKGVNDSKNDGEEWLLTHNSTITSSWYRTVTDYSSNGASMVMLCSDASHYNLAIISNAEASDYNYLYFFGANGTNNNNVYFMRNNAVASPIYTSDRPGAQLTFNYVTANYIYNIVDTHGNVAIKYSVNDVGVGTPLTGYDDIPEAIRSPYLEGETITFYSTFTEGSRENLSNPITNTPAGGGNIYVAYTTEHLTDIEKPLHLRGNRPFKIRVNGEYVFDNNGSFSHTTSDGAGDNSYLWKVSGGDPYAVYIQNIGNAEHYFNWNTSASPTLTLGASSRFIIFGGSVARPEGVLEGFNDQLELMAATGEDISSSNYYNVGCDSDVGLLASNAYPHGNDAIQVLLKAVQKNVTFHIIDMSGRIVVEQSGAFDDLAVPEQWRSPLVATYHYYKASDFTVSDGVYKLRRGVSEIAEFLDAPADIYVTYDPNDDYDLDGSERRAVDGKKYLLKFAGGTSFLQEKGDGFETSPDEGIYPYINGEGGLFVYGQTKLTAQKEDVASTRTRWAWYLEGGDPYRLRISSLQTRTDGSTDDTHYSYLRTYKPQGYTEVVTGVITNNPSVYDLSDDDHAERHKPTDYMVLKGTGGHLRLVTSDVVDDLDGNATNDMRQTVTSFENYWKTNPTAANVIHATDETFAVGSTPTEAQITAALTTGTGAKGWHSYNVWANGSTWTNSKKAFGYGPHWFQTIGVGTETEGVFNGDFDLVEYRLDGALILLDQHGWEVMRKPITNLSTDKPAYAIALKKYDSPMVKRYHFWTNFTKESGYHKYKPTRGQTNESKNAQHKGEGISLADYPEVFSTGTLADIYVTYEVMSTYRNGYKGGATADATEASKYLVRQGANYAKTTDGTTITSVPVADVTDLTTVENNMLWYIKPNFNIDTEMGYNYEGQYDEKTQAETEANYLGNTEEAAVYDKTYGQNGFDPYNIQIESVGSQGKLFTTNATDAIRDGNGGMESSYTGDKTVTLQNYASRFSASDYYDIGTGYQIPQVSNSTFMAISDGNDNIRLMPRFDHHNVETSFTILAAQQQPAPYTDEEGTQTILFVSPDASSSLEGLVHSSDEIVNMNGNYILADDFEINKVVGTATKPFTGTIDGQLYTIDGVYRPFIAYADGATIKNVIMKNVSFTSGNAVGNAGAICCEATGTTRIYNCGILPTTTERDKEGNITGFTGSSVGGSNDVGGIVGKLSENARVINCFSYATITGGSTVAGIVGNIGYAANTSITQDDVDSKPMVVNCMFYGDITGGTSVSPVYGGATGAMIKNDNTKGVNPYCYFRKKSSFNNTTNFGNIDAFKRSWPAEEKNLTRFEYYRSILNSNRKLCTWWVNGTNGTAPTDEDVNNVDIAKWVLDPGIAPYPILKKWGKYPSVINIDPDKVWDPRTEIKEGDVVTPVTPHWVQRSTANEWEGKSYGTLAVTIKAGVHGSGSTSRNIAITDMDTLNCDYSYYKIQLPYYNEVFGNPNGATHAEKYGGNYTEYVVTGWEITVDGSTTATDYNFADRNSITGRVFAQGGYYYVPKEVSSISITARWGKAIYLSNRGYSIDRVNVTNAGYKADNAFAPAGTVSNTFQGQPVYDDLQNAIKALGTNTDSPTVYDQAIVLIGNHQVKNGNNDVGYNLDSKWHPFTIMSADFDFDNEPDYSLQFQFRDKTPRPGIQPIRFDFLPVVELGLALRHNSWAYAIGIFVPQGHFEVTETAFMRTTQFEYDGFQNYTDKRIEDKSPVIINGGEYEMFVVRYHDSNRTSYFLLGGNAWIHRFAPGAHPSNANPKIYLCPINVIGGQVKELYLTGLYRPELLAPTNQGAPRCYTDGGKFDIMAGAGYEKVEAGSNVTFKINHSKITEFYGGGINATNPISGNIDVTIDNSYVDKYCGGPKVGDMTGKTVTTHATGTTFGVFYGGGNGGNSYYRHLQKDGDQNSNHIGTWTDQGYNWGGFNPLGVKDDGTDNKGYHAEYEFEVFNHSNGVTDQITQRGFIRWIQFGRTITGDVENTLIDCKVNTNFYGGGNLATVNGTVTSTLTNTNVKGNVFGAGYSADIPTFTVHDKDKKVFPSMDFAGTITDGYIPNKQEDNEDIKYEWTNDLNGKTEDERKADPAYSKTVVEDGIEVKKWYCYTWNSLDNLGAVLNNVTLTLGGDSKVGTEGNPKTGNVYGGGDASAVKKKEGVADSGNTTVILQGNAEVLGNVFGGGNQGLVEGSATVNIQ